MENHSTIQFYKEGKQPTRYLVPGDFNGLSLRQLLLVMEVLSSGMKIEKAKVRVLGILLKLDRKIFLSYFLKKNLGIEGLHTACSTTDFVFGKSTLTQNKILSLKIPQGFRRSRYYYAPASDKLLSHMIFLEWIKFEIHYRNYINSSDARELNHMIASVYRPRGSNKKGERREEYNDYLVPHRARSISKVPFRIRYAILYYFMAHRAIWERKFTAVYKSANDAVSGNTNTSKNLFDLLRDMAGGAMHMEKMGSTPASVALTDLNDKIISNTKL
jgi:hypothetical protein